jgi:hypothetical protein
MTWAFTWGKESNRSSNAVVKAIDNPLPAGFRDVLHNLSIAPMLDVYKLTHLTEFGLCLMNLNALTMDNRADQHAVSLRDTRRPAGCILIFFLSLSWISMYPPWLWVRFETGTF